MLEAYDAPQIPSSSIVSRIILGTILLCCCGGIAMLLLFVASFFVKIPDLQQQLQQQLQLQLQRMASTPVLEINQHNVDPRHHRHAQRSVLQRLAMLKRAHAPEHGVDRASVATAFPRWLHRNGGYDSDVVLGDMALALSYLSALENE